MGQEGSPSWKGHSMKASWILFAGISAGSLTAQSHIEVQLNNTANTPHHAVSMAEAVGSSLFERAGIRIEWIECLSGATDPRRSLCMESSDPDQFTVVIRQDDGRARPHDSALGFAMPFSGMRNHAAVLWRPISRTAQDNAGEVNEGTLLGTVIAHELGHLLMGSGDHGPGVMNANWLRSDFIGMGQHRFRFTPGQIEQLRQGLERRNRLAGGPVLLARRREDVIALDALK
jgi:hypothetical protein